MIKRDYVILEQDGLLELSGVAFFPLTQRDAKQEWPWMAAIASSSRGGVGPSEAVKRLEVALGKPLYYHVAGTGFPLRTYRWSQFSERSIEAASEKAGNNGALLSTLGQIQLAQIYLLGSGDTAPEADVEKSAGIPFANKHLAWVESDERISVRVVVNRYPGEQTLWESPQYVLLQGETLRRVVPIIPLLSGTWPAMDRRAWFEPRSGAGKVTALAVLWSQLELESGKRLPQPPPWMTEEAATEIHLVGTDAEGLSVADLAYAIVTYAYQVHPPASGRTWALFESPSCWQLTEVTMP